MNTKQEQASLDSFFAKVRSKFLMYFFSLVGYA
ncbi:hypothetical protein P781_16600 [Vibrio mimicus CAIM 1883]|nr:hypothetical protein P780_16650 [Vibrio mimicus CAIM 1882]ERM53530.1 hypothetical protein P781_16600 [Vibrio mimicus CAIM 1883]